MTESIQQYIDRKVIEKQTGPKKSIVNEYINTYHWTKLNYNLYRLVGFHTIKEFPSYEELYAYCIKHQIDAKQI